MDFIRDLCKHPKFRSGDVHTAFIEENRDALFPQVQVTNETVIQAALLLLINEEIDSLNLGLQKSDLNNPFVSEMGFRLNHVHTREFNLEIMDKSCLVRVKYLEPDVYSIKVDNVGPWRRVSGKLTKNGNLSQLTTEIDGVKLKARVVKTNDELYIFNNVSFTLN